MKSSENAFNSLLKKNESIRHMVQKSFLDLKYTLLQQHKYEVELMMSYFFSEDKNPTNFVSKALSTLTGNERKIIKETLENKNKDRRLYNKITAQLLSKNSKFSAKWVTPPFRRAWQKLKVPSNTRHLRPLIENNRSFLKLTGLDSRVLIDFLDANFFFETNLARWAYGGTEIV